MNWPCRLEEASGTALGVGRHLTGMERVMRQDGLHLQEQLHISISLEACKAIVDNDMEYLRQHNLP